jgi:hypothetical protein
LRIVVGDLLEAYMALERGEDLAAPVPDRDEPRSTAAGPALA